MAPERGRQDFKVASKSGSQLSCVLTESSATQPEQDLGVLVLIHSSPLGHRGSAPLPQLSALLTAATVRFDLSGCGGSSGEPQVAAHSRDVADIRSVVQHVQRELNRKVLGLVGFALGGTAALLYAAQHRDVPCVATISAPVTLTNAFSSVLKWSQLQELRQKGELLLPHQDDFGRNISLRLTNAELDHRPDLSGLATCTETDFLGLYGSKDATVPPSDVAELESLLRGSRSAELRTVPAVDHTWEGQESTLAYAIGEWLWRRSQTALEPAAGDVARPSGFNIFVDSLALQVKEIHAEARLQLPSIGIEHPSSSDDGEDEPPIMTARYPRPNPISS